MRLQALILAVIVAAAPSAGRAATGSIPHEETDAIVLRFQAVYADTFNRRDAKGMAALLTENATLQNEWGDVTQGRTNIELLLIRLMSNLQTGTKLEDTSLASQSVAANIIVSQGISRRIVPDADPAQMFFTRVLVLEGGQWKLAATQIARPSTMPKPITPTPTK
jgi:ketosteroid isomerase-like protein